MTADANPLCLCEADTYFQPAIDNAVLRLQRLYNTGSHPIIFNTYQLYLTDSHDRVHTDMLKAQRGGYHFACKVVRGAYMTLERERAREKEEQQRAAPVAEVLRASARASGRAPRE